MTAFNRSGEDHQWWCRECFRQYFRERGRKHREQSGAAQRARKARARQHILALLKRRPCVDCGESEVAVLEFDHVRGKRATIAHLTANGAPTEALDEEIARCDVVCANCHRRRTIARRGGFRLTLQPCRGWDHARLRTEALLYLYLRSVPCTDCGESDPVVLDFDHRKDKMGNVSALTRTAGLRRVFKEVAKCDVRCANCHRVRTHVSQRTYRAEGIEFT